MDKGDRRGKKHRKKKIRRTPNLKTQGGGLKGTGFSDKIRALRIWINGQWTKKLVRQQLACVGAALLVTVLLYVCQNQSSPLLVDGSLQRSAPGGNTTSYPLMLEGLLEEALPVEIEVSPQRYSREEADQLFRDVVWTIEERIAGENDNLSSVHTDLNLITSIQELGLRLTWDYTPYLEEADEEEQRAYFKRYSRLIEEDGSVNNETLKEGEEVSGYLSLVLETYILPEGDEAYEKRRYQSEPFQIFVYVTPRRMTEGERLEKIFFEAVSQADKQSYGEDTMQLPEMVEGKKLRYTGRKDNSYLLIAVLGVVAALALGFREKAEVQRERKRREAQLLLDYAELISKLMVYIGAGLTVRNAFEKISEGYDKQVERGMRKDRYLYRELRVSRRQFERGAPESQVYTEFGKRINLKPYTKLCSLIEQNRKNGMKNMRVLLNLEMAEAFEQRKNQAKRMGEEAGTKLLLPLFLLLGIVMTIVIVPAMLALG